MPTYKFLKKIDFDAVGGPPLQIGDGKYARTPTRSGRFIIVSTGKHVSTGKYLYSTIAWGTPLREHNGIVQIKDKGVWKNLMILVTQLSNMPKITMRMEFLMKEIL